MLLFYYVTVLTFTTLVMDKLLISVKQLFYSLCLHLISAASLLLHYNAAGASCFNRFSFQIWKNVSATVAHWKIIMENAFT